MFDLGGITNLGIKIVFEILAINFIQRKEFGKILFIGKVLIKFEQKLNYYRVLKKYKMLSCKWDYINTKS